MIIKVGLEPDCDFRVVKKVQNDFGLNLFQVQKIENETKTQSTHLFDEGVIADVNKDDKSRV